MTVSVTDIANALKTIFVAGLTDIDHSSITEYEPSLKTNKIGLLIAPFEQSGRMHFSRVGPYSVSHAHRIPCQFWVRADVSRYDTGAQRGRDICLSAMRLLAANPELNVPGAKVGSWEFGNEGQIGEYNVQGLLTERNQIPHVVATLYVYVQIDEVISL